MESFVSIVRALPAYSSHEHIGSVPSAGMVNGFPAFRADVEPGCAGDDTGLMDLVLSPYMGGLFTSLGYHPDGAADPLTRWKRVKPFLTRIAGTGLFNALDEALSALYGLPLRAMLDGGDEAFLRGDRAVREAYRGGMYRHNAEVFGRAHILGAVKPVHVGYLQALSSVSTRREAVAEANCFVPILRVDDLLGFLRGDGTADWSHAEAAFGRDVRGLEDIEYLVSEAFRLVDRLRIPAIKQLQAYSRTLSYGCPSREEALRATAGDDWRQDPACVRVAQDYTMHCVLREASVRAMPYQIHTGMANLPDSNPVGLRSVVEMYPDVRFVLLHCYPYLSEAAYMARVYPNVWLDAAWLALQSPGVLKKALDEWIGFVPYERLFLSADATSTEECFGAYEIMRRVLARCLIGKVGVGELDAPLAERIARAMLNENARCYAPGMIEQTM